MPVYTYQCACGAVTDSYNRIDDRHNGPLCECGDIMLLKIMPVMFSPILGGGKINGYECPVTGRYVTSKKVRREIMAEHNLIEKDRSNIRPK